MTGEDRTMIDVFTGTGDDQKALAARENILPPELLWRSWSFPGLFDPLSVLYTDKPLAPERL